MRVVVLGGGVSGLNTARILGKEHEVLVLEKNDRFGGLASSFKINDSWIPFFFFFFIERNTKTLEYLKKYGLDKGLKWKRIRMSICVNNKVYDFVNPISLLRFDYLSFWERIRYGLFGAYVLWLMNPSRIPDSVNAREWLHRVVGKGVTEKIFKQLYERNKFDVSLSKISAKQFANRLKSAEFKVKFAYPRKGFQGLINGLVNDCKKRGVKLRANVSVKGFDVKKKVIKFNNKKEKYDILINTIPIPVFLRLSKGLPRDYFNQLSKVKYCPAVCVVYGAENHPTEYYWSNFLNERIGINVNHSILCDNHEESVNWALRYGGSVKDLPLSDEKITKAYLGVVKKYFPETRVVWSKVFRERYSSPIYDSEYYKYKPGYVTPVKGLYHAGVSVTYPLVRDVNSALISSEQVSKIISKDLRSRNQ